MATIIITPCTLGFDVRVRQHYAEATLGIMTFSEVISFLLSQWRIDYALVVR